MPQKERFKLIPTVYLLLRRGNEVLLLKRVNTGYQDGKYSVITGHLEGDELATAGIVREAKEEAGITIDPTNIKLVHTCHRLTRNDPGQERMDLIFETATWQGEVANAEPHKCDDLSWFRLDALPDNMLPLVRNIINDVERGVNFSEYEEEPLD
jgi:8-oxo-dGTP diphosphatase